MTTNVYIGKKVLVAGADGFLGYNMVLRLKELGARVSILSRHDRPRAAEGFYDRLFCGDLRDRSLVKSAVSGQEIVFDLAGSSGAVMSNRDPFRHLEEECSPHLSLFQACAEEEQPPMVTFCSTRLVYGRPAYLPVDEAHPLSPQTMYAVHKITLEHYLKVLSQTNGLPYVVMRLSNPFGPHQPATTRNYGIINIFLRSAATGKPVTIFGDGAQKRDYVFIDDVINAFLLLAVTGQCKNQIFNFGGHEPISILDAALLIRDLAGGLTINMEPWPQDYKTVETGDYSTDLSKILEFVNLPNPTPLKEGFSATLEYYKTKKESIV